MTTTNRLLKAAASSRSDNGRGRYVLLEDGRRSYRFALSPDGMDADAANFTLGSLPPPPLGEATRRGHSLLSDSRQPTHFHQNATRSTESQWQDDDMNGYDGVNGAPNLGPPHHHNNEQPPKRRNPLRLPDSHSCETAGSLRHSSFAGTNDIAPNIPPMESRLAMAERHDVGEDDLSSYSPSSIRYDPNSEFASVCCMLLPLYCCGRLAWCSILLASHFVLFRMPILFMSEIQLPMVLPNKTYLMLIEMIRVPLPLIFMNMCTVF